MPRGGFTASPRLARACTPAMMASWDGGGESGRQELEFTIYPDGRVEEKVLGVKGTDCQKVTEKINEALGEVYESKPTQEMFEQKVEVEVEAEAKNEERW